MCLNGRSRAVPELTRNVDIHLNPRVLLIASMNSVTVFIEHCSFQSVIIAVG
jgi:hypothetical protein